MRRRIPMRLPSPSRTREETASIHRRTGTAHRRMRMAMKPANSRPKVVIMVGSIGNSLR